MTTGKSKGDFPGGYIPFDKSVGTVPTVPIDSEPTVQLCVNEDWLPFVVTCLKALARPETWDDTYDNAVIAASEFAALVSGIHDGCGVIVPSIMCISGSFKDLDYGFVAQPGAFCAPTWVAGTGWQQCCDSTPQAFLNIKREFGGTTIIRAVSVVILVTPPYLVDYSVKLLHGTTYTIIASDSAVTGPTIVVDVTGLSEPAESLWIDVVETFGGCAADIVVQDWSICYTGSFPLSDTRTSSVHQWLAGAGLQSINIPTFPGCTATYDSANDQIVGCDQSPASNGFVAWAEISVPSGIHVTRVEVQVDWDQTFANTSLELGMSNDNHTTFFYSHLNGSVSSEVFDGDSGVIDLVGPFTLQIVTFAAYGSNPATNHANIKKILVTTAGADPF